MPSRRPRRGVSTRRLTHSCRSNCAMLTSTQLQVRNLNGSLSEARWGAIHIPPRDQSCPDRVSDSGLPSSDALRMALIAIAIMEPMSLRVAGTMNVFPF